MSDSRARNAVTSVELAELGAYASETALDGAAGLFAALGRRDRVSGVNAFAAGQPLEILSVYHKPAPACNYAQTACQVARSLAVEDGVRVEGHRRHHREGVCRGPRVSRLQCDRPV